MKRAWMMLGAASMMFTGCNGTTYGNDDPYRGPDDYYPGGSTPPNDTSNPFDGEPSGIAANKGPQPTFKSVHQADAPPAISGGTLLVTSDGDHVVAADPD